MYVYHLDRGHRLKEGQTLNLFPLVENPISRSNNAIIDPNPLSNNLKVHGFEQVSFFINCLASQPFYDNSAAIEFKVEGIRKMLFPDKPSRITSMFGVLSLNDLEKWRTTFEKTKSAYDNRKIPIWKIECTTCSQEFDARFLRGDNLTWYREEMEYAYKYWSSEKSNNPLPEVLIPLPAKVISLAGYF